MDQYERFCRGEFGEVKGQLAQIDKALRGNGEPGIVTRLDRLEVAARLRSRFAWFIAGAFIGPIATALVALAIKAIFGA